MLPKWAGMARRDVLAMWVSWHARRSHGPRLVVWSEVGQRDGLVAMRAGTAGTDAAAEQLAVVAPLLAQVAGTAPRALVDGCEAWRSGGYLWRCGRVALAPGRLPARV